MFSDDGEYLIMLMIDYTFTCQNSRKKANKLELRNALKICAHCPWPAVQFGESISFYQKS
jgi:hypothetical protein